MNDGKNKEERFINQIIERRCDIAYISALKRADNPNHQMAFDASKILCRWVNLNDENEYIPYSIIGASVARRKPEFDGHLGLGEAIDRCYNNNDVEKSNPSETKLKLLMCNSTKKVCLMLRQPLEIINSRDVPLNYGRLLNQLVWFRKNGDYYKRLWTTEFYGKKYDESEGNEDVSI